ncbi:Slx4p interacting protein [Malassezia sp. CBS 17886]|nr:Slx4p interacting protein [Malassezia sp. CBS 17886]
MARSSLMAHTVPPLYVCYFLRSLAKPNVTYIGSTNDPERRLRQHNGLVKNGARATRWARPWTMEAVVCGFPSKIAALQVRGARQLRVVFRAHVQFEWSWQKPHLTRRLRLMDMDEPLYPGTQPTRIPRVKRASTVPEERMLAMRALLSSEPYCFWGLQVVFFSEFTYALWRYSEKKSVAQALPRWRVSRRIARPLPDAYPAVVCDFTGVAADREPLGQDDTADAYPRLAEAATASAAQQRHARPRVRRRAPTAAAGDPWQETPPPARDAETLGFSWADVVAAPALVPAPAHAAVPAPPRKRRHPLHALDDRCTVRPD